MLCTSLERSARVIDKLLLRFGPDRLRRVEQLSANCCRAELTGGDVALAAVLCDGTVVVKGPEEGVCADD